MLVHRQIGPVFWQNLSLHIQRTNCCKIWPEARNFQIFFDQTMRQIILQIYNLQQTSNSDRRTRVASANCPRNAFVGDISGTMYKAFVQNIAKYYKTLQNTKKCCRIPQNIAKCHKLLPKSWEKLLWDAFVGAISGVATMKRDQYLVMVIISTIAHRSIRYNGPYFFDHKYDYGKGDD